MNVIVELWISEEVDPPMKHESATPEPAREPLGGGADRAARVHNSPKSPKNDRDATDVESEPAIDEKSIGKLYFKRHRATTLLLALFVIMIVLAFLLYPRRQPVYRPQAFQVDIVTSTTFTGALIYVEKVASNRFSLSIYIYADAPKSANRVFGAVYVNLPAPASCKPSCHSDLSPNGAFSGQTDYIREFIASFHPMTAKTNYIALTGSSQWEASAQFFITAPVFAWDENGLDVEGQLPAVQLLAFPRQSLGDPNIWIYYALSNATYDWTGGPAPNYSHRSSQQILSVWVLPVKELLSPTQVSGTDNSNASDDSFRTFVSGVLLGIAGGAFVGAIQEASHSKRRTRVSANRSTKVTISRAEPS